MGVALSKVISDIGEAVQRANVAIERYAADAYINQGYSALKDEDGNITEYLPLIYTLNLESTGSNKKVQVPVTALVNHNSLQLAQVDVKLKFLLEENEYNEMMVKVTSMESANPLQTSEMVLQFKTSVPTEGVSRLETKHSQLL